MLTLEKVRSFKKELEFIQEQCDDLLSSRTRAALFTSADNRDLEINAAMRFPSDYYCFRSFDIKIEIRVDRKGDYFVFVDGSYILPSDLFDSVVGKLNYYYASAPSLMVEDKEKQLGYKLSAVEKNDIRLLGLQFAVKVWSKAVECYVHDKYLSSEELNFGV